MTTQLEPPELTFLQQECMALMQNLLPEETTVQDVNAVQTAFYSGVSAALNQLKAAWRKDAKKGSSVAAYQMGVEVNAYVQTRFLLNKETVERRKPPALLLPPPQRP